MLYHLTYGLARRDRGDQQALRDGDIRLQAAGEQAQAQPKEAQVAAIWPMQPLEPAIAQRTNPEVHNPQIGQAGNDQQAGESLRVAEMALVEMKAATFLVGEEGFNGMITNDKFCCTRWTDLQLSWWRRPLRLRS